MGADSVPTPTPAAPRRARGLARLPIRVRLTLIFGMAMLFVLAVSGLVVFERVRSQVDSTLDVDISRRASALVSTLARSPSSLAQIVAARPGAHGHQSFVQVLDPDGRVIAGSAGLQSTALLSRAQLQTALRREMRTDRRRADPLPDGARLISTPITVAGHGHAVLVVGTSLDERSASLSSLALALGIVGPIAILVATLAGYRLTAATLRPVELMRRQADTVSAAEPGVRLPLPSAEDEIRQLGVTLNDMLDRLEASFAREQTFVANASHELRTPLSTLRTELDLALRRPRSHDELVEALRSVQAEVDRLSALADDMLVLARGDDGALPMRRTPLDSTAVFAAAARPFGAAGRARVQIAEQPGLRFEGDRERIEQGLAILIDNALRYSEGEVLLAARPTATGDVELHVRDHGPGFPPAFLEDAFERFSRADPGRAGRGAGLGLSIARMIARAHGGDALAANTATGADVWLVIPGSRGG